MSGPDVLRSVRVRWCEPCGTLRQHLRGRCAMEPWHLSPCACGRPTPGGEPCSQCAVRDDGDRLVDQIEDAAAAAAEDASW